MKTNFVKRITISTGKRI